MRPSRFLRTRAKAKAQPSIKFKPIEPSDPLKGFQTAGGGSALLERAGRRDYEDSTSEKWNPIIMGFVPNEMNQR